MIENVQGVLSFVGPKEGEPVPLRDAEIKRIFGEVEDKDGREVILAILNAGEFFGEMSLIAGGTSPATVTTVVPSLILTVTHESFIELIENHSINRGMLKMLCARCRDTSG